MTGRPLSPKSRAIVTLLRDSGARMTYTEVAQHLQLARRDALVTCDRLADAGHLVVIGTRESSGRRPASVYGAAEPAPVPALTVIWHSID